MRVPLPEYNGKDTQVMLLLMPLFGFVLNIIIMGQAYFSRWYVFLLATVIGAIASCIDFIICGLVAVEIRNRFPQECQTIKRLSLMIVIFLLLSGFYLLILFNVYRRIPIFNYQITEERFTWSYFALGILNIFVTFLMEGISRYRDWTKNRLEADKMSHSYKKSQLQGLKSQVSPHFLFNSLNILSSLIHEDEEKAERFLDEMSKVYRYMLRNDESQLVSLETELKFIQSYHHLLKARFGDGLQLHIDVSEQDRSKLLTPLALQVIIENAFSQNIVSKSMPLLINISSAGENVLEIHHNLQPKTITDAVDFDESLDNLVKRYALLSQPLAIEESPGQRLIRISLVLKKEEVAV